MDPILIIGPTAIGKSDLAMRLAIEFTAEIVSIDSRQIYKRLDIGTAKPTLAERVKVPHHLIDILDIDEKPDANTFGVMARDTIEEIAGRNTLPILVGGSGMYLRSVLEGLFKIDLAPEERKIFADEVVGVSTEILFDRLRNVDMESSERIHSNDRYRIVRALEVFTLTGVTISEHFSRQRSAKKDLFPYNIIKVGLKKDRKGLRDVIKKRTLAMFENGWVEKVIAILEGGAKTSCPVLKTLGYPEIIKHINGAKNKDETIADIVTQTRQYAKRQMTWFNKESSVKWIDTEEEDPFNTLIKWLDRRGRS